MRDKFKKLMIISLVTSIFLLVIGIILLFYAKLSVEIIGYGLAIALVINGVCNIVDDYKIFKLFYFFDGFTIGLLSVIMGITILSNLESFTIVIPILLGIWFILCSTFKLRMTLALRDSKNKNWLTCYLLTMLTIVTGLCLIFNPLGNFLTISKVIGISVVIYTVCDIIESTIFLNSIKAVAKVFE